MLKNYIGDKYFYRRVLRVAIPIIVQNGITNFVSMLDNIMVGQVGTVPMSGVSIVNNLLLIFNLCIFGAISGAGILTAQFHGSANEDGIRQTFRFKFLICLLLTLAGGLIFTFANEPLIGIYLTGDGDPLDIVRTKVYGMDYLKVMIWGFLPFALSNTYSSTMRETGDGITPMLAGIVAVFVNLGLNYVLIFGHFGAPALGVVGAAWATVISRYVEFFIVAIWTHAKVKRYPYIKGAYRSLYIPKDLMSIIIRMGLPLLANEFIWSMGVAIKNQCYSTCGLDVVPAMNIASTLFTLGSVVFQACGNSVGIIMGQMMGAGRPKEEIQDHNRKLIAFSVVIGTLFGSVIAAFSVVFPAIYKTTPDVRYLATVLICINAALIPFNSFTNATYFTLRSGGQTTVTFIFDSCFIWGVCVPVAFVLSRYTGIGIIPLYLICQGTDMIKCIVGAKMLKQGKWIQNLTA